MIHKSIILVVLFILIIAVSGLSGEKSSPELKMHTGTVIETERASHYLYLLVNVDGDEFWISTIAKYLPEDIAKGDTIVYSGGMIIQGFNSIAMKKSFDTMLLVSKIRVARPEPGPDSNSTQ
jgi:hypothetical protein